jgi:hypothetical protein
MGRRKLVHAVPLLLLVVLIGAGVAGVVVFVLSSRAREYERREARPQDEQVQEAFRIVGALATAPDTLGEYFSADATRKAESVAEGVVEALSRAESIVYGDSAWFGDYLRLTVEGEAGGDSFHVVFLFRQEEEGLRITGVER